MKRRVLSREECDAIGDSVLSRVTVPAAEVSITSVATAGIEFARGDTHMASEGHGASVALNVDVGGRRSGVRTDRLDDAGLTTLVREAEALARQHRTPIKGELLGPQTYPKGGQIQFDSVVAMMEPDAQSDLFRRATDATEARHLVGAGTITLEHTARWVRNTRGLHVYEQSTYGELSVTARTKDGTGSGWGWSGFEDWARVEPAAVIERAIDLGERSAKPVALEPGRYTVILEPTATAALLESILSEWQARAADGGYTVFANAPIGTNKIGLQMIDRTLDMTSSPWDPDRPASAINGDWTPIPKPVTWFDKGVLTNLSYDEEYARQKGRPVVIRPGGLRLTPAGSSATLDEMIASTKRGIWVNRLSNVTLMNRRTLLLTGTTRDGTFLIENGRITKAIKNFRFTESPFFVLNKLEASGTPVRASRWVVAPRLKLRDFDFTSLTDAV
jgi:predicted Zn-dependent protease